MAPSSGNDASAAPTSSSKSSNKQQMGLFDAINLLLACIIGSGIFISAKSVLEFSGSYGLSIGVWIGCGIICIMGAFCYAELGCAYVSSGGDYTYLRLAYGNFIGFLRVWIEVALSRPMIVVLSVLTASNYVIYAFYPTCQPPKALIKSLSAMFLFIVGFINLTSKLATNRLHKACNYFKIGSLSIVIIAGLYRLYLGSFENFSEPFEGSKYSSLTGAFYAGLFPYCGWNYLNNAIDNLKNPKYILPRSIIISLLLCIFVYLLTFSSYFTALSAYEIMVSDATALSFVQRVFPLVSFLIPIGVTMSCLGAASGNIFTIGEMFNVAGRDGMMPHIFSMKHHETGVPMVAILCEIILSFVFLFFMSNIGQLIVCVGMINWICILFASVGLIILRFKDPDRERPFRVHMAVPIIFIVILCLLIGASAWEDPDNVRTSLILLATAIPAYVFGVMWEKKPANMMSRYHKVALILQKVFHVVHDTHDE